MEKRYILYFPCQTTICAHCSQGCWKRLSAAYINGQTLLLFLQSALHILRVSGGCSPAPATTWAVSWLSPGPGGTQALPTLSSESSTAPWISLVLFFSVTQPSTASQKQVIWTALEQGYRAQRQIWIEQTPEKY